MSWYAKQGEEVLAELYSSQQGLSASEAATRLERYGPNALPEGKRDSWVLLFFRQFSSALIYILLIAAIALAIMGDTRDALIIAVVLLLNAIVGSVQEGRAQNTLLSLKKFAETTATVRRDNREMSFPSHEVVPGDILILSEGERIPADSRVLVSNGLKIDEAALTGESEPVHKQTDILPTKELPVTDQKNMVFSGTHIVAGSGQAVVVATGLETVMGHIAKKITTIETEIPLKAEIRQLAHVILFAVFALTIFLMGYGFVAGLPLEEMFKVAVALAVSGVPEGLPVVVTLVLATGVWRMSKRNALVKRLQAVEALGQARIIAVDKTGTITRNQMVIERVYVNGTHYSVTGSGYDTAGDIVNEESGVSARTAPEIQAAAHAAAFCASAHITYLADTKEWRVSGDPTEAALLVFGEKGGVSRDSLLREHPLLHEIPFSYENKYHATVYKWGAQAMSVVVGSPEEVLALCQTIWSPDGKSEAMDGAARENITQVIADMADQGLRVLAFATGEGDIRGDAGLTDRRLTFGGLYGMKDGLRPEVHQSLKLAREAGAKVVMITGDHMVTARAVAREAGIYREGDEVMTGKDLVEMSDEKLATHLPRTTVFARVTPDHKLRIVQAYQRAGEVIAMTGDGVNDAPSLVAADLGVAMGGIGTEVAKEAADIVLLDDNFGSIVSAMEEGRHIYRTVRKVTLYLLSTGVAEVLTVLVAIIAGYPLPILAVQILWLNLVTDGFLDIALGMDPKDKGLLAERLKKPRLLNAVSIIRIFVMALPMVIGALWIFTHYLPEGLLKAQTMTLTVMAMFQWFNVWNCRSEYRSVFSSNPFSNLYLVGAQVVIILLQIAAVYTGFLQFILRTVPLAPDDWLLAGIVASSILFVEEGRKFIHRRLM
ncbi:MAG: HAD-IC family P-type ATPase [Candidatus Andersenbacteria bacterium]